MLGLRGLFRPRVAVKDLYDLHRREPTRRKETRSIGWALTPEFAFLFERWLRTVSPLGWY